MSTNQYNEEFFEKDQILRSLLGQDPITILTEKDCTEKPDRYNQIAIYQEYNEEISPEPMPILSPKALYGLAGEFVREATKDSEADPVGVLITLLAYFAISAGRKRYYQLAFARHNPRLFAVIVGASSKARKGTSWEPVKALFDRMKELGADVTASRPGPFSSGEGIIFAMRDASGEVDPKTKEPKDPGVMDKRLFVCTSEFAAGLRAARREGNILSTVIRALYDGEDIAPLIKNNPTRATAPHGGIIGHITKQELKKELDHVEVFNGFANRFLWVYVRRQKLVPFPKAVDETAFGEFAQRFIKALRFAQQMGEVKLSKEVIQIWPGVYEKLQEELPGIAGVLNNRSETHVIRIALIYALLDQSEFIQTKHLEAALALWEYCRQSVFYIFGGGEIDNYASRILSALKHKPLSQTEISKLFSGHLSSDRLRQTLSDLEGTNRIERETVKIPGNRTKTIWKLPAKEKEQDNYAN
jgi:hypothetical protein